MNSLRPAHPAEWPSGKKQWYWRPPGQEQWYWLVPLLLLTIRYVAAPPVPHAVALRSIGEGLIFFTVLVIMDALVWPPPAQPSQVRVLAIKGHRLRLSANYLGGMSFDVDEVAVRSGRSCALLVTPRGNFLLGPTLPGWSTAVRTIEELRSADDTASPAPADTGARHAHVDQLGLVRCVTGTLVGASAWAYYMLAYKVLPWMHGRGNGWEALAGGLVLVFYAWGALEALLTCRECSCAQTGADGPRA